MHAEADAQGDQEDVTHPHDLRVGRPERLPTKVLRDLSTLEPARALGAVAVEWLGVLAAVCAFAFTPDPWRWALYPALVMFIGARQHAMTVIGHDASHYRFLPNRFLNDHLGNALLQWPVFISVEGFRTYHGAHHKYLGEERDGNRELWGTHDDDGAQSREWTYPKSRAQLVLKVIKRASVLTGVWWIVRGFIGGVLVRSSWWEVVARVVYYAAIAALFTWQGWWLEFALLWLVPYCTWHMACQYMRLIAEHSALSSPDPAFAATRTTIPRWWEALFILPRNIGYHIEHHWFPSVPFYKLPALHAALMERPRFATHARISRSLMGSLAEVTGEAKAA